MGKPQRFVFWDTSLSIVKNEAEYRLWRLVNWRASYADFYAWQVSRKLDRGEAHKTLGKRLIGDNATLDHDSDRDRFSNDRKRELESGVNILDELKALGLKPKHKVVEYGCGSLRAGRYFIDYLQAGKFQGLDITDRFYRDGLDLLDQDMRAKKRPQCFVINDDSLETIAGTKPDFIYSIAVTQHVPPAEIDRFIANICSLMGEKTRLALYFVEAAKPARVKGKSWVYTGAQLLDLFATHQPLRSFEIKQTGLKRTSVRVEAWTSVLLSKPARPDKK